MTSAEYNQAVAELAKEAMEIQSARSLKSLSKRFANVVGELIDLNEEKVKANPMTLTRFENVRTHPIVRLWVRKLHDMAGMGSSDTDRYGEAYYACQKLAPWPTYSDGRLNPSDTSD